MEKVNDRLRAADGEGGDDDLAAAVGGTLHHVAKLIGGFVDWLVCVPAVSTFGDDEIRSRQRFRVVQDRQADAAEIAGEGDTLVAKSQMNCCGTQQMARVTEGRLDGFADGDCRTVVHRLQARQGTKDIALIVNWFNLWLAR